MLRYRIILLSSILLLTSCVTTQEKTASVETQPVAVSEPPLAAVHEFKEESKKVVVTTQQVELDIWQRMVQDYQLQQFDNAFIDKQIKQFSAHPLSLARRLERSRPFLFYIHQELQKRNMPGELALLPAIESGFIPTAYSHYGAAGLWQFMPATGKSFGLKQDWWYDARRDTLASTDAALDYLQALHKRFDGNWLLALAAYNSGGGTVSNAIKRNKKKNRPTDFWSLELPRETRNYVPRLLALARITENASLYELALPEIDCQQHFAKVNIESQMDLKVASKLAGMKPKDLLSLNAGFNRWVTHPNGPHHLLLPVDAVAQFETGFAQLPQDQRLRWERYKIRSGDNLGQIAKKYSITVAALKKSNNLKSSRIRAGKHLMIPLSGAPITVDAFASTLHAKTRVRYKVRKGDSLSRIASRYNVKIRDLKKWNRLSSSRIRAGQRLTVLVNPSTASG